MLIMPHAFVVSKFFFSLCSSFSNEPQTNFLVTEEVDLKSAPLFFFFSLSGLKYTQQVEGSICVWRRKCVSHIFSAASEPLSDSD